MDFERARIEDVETRVKSAVERAKEKQEELNAVVSFVAVSYTHLRQHFSYLLHFENRWFYLPSL